jgi:CMP-N,N'-diacetyllegionaminic acid synthase
MKVLALITARGGSKGLPGKNTRNFHGHPLIAWTVRHAIEASNIDSVVVSTDDQAIADAAKKYGAEIPFLRPSNLATDYASSLDVVIHTLEELKKNGKEYDVLVLLQPTSPLRSSGDLSGMVNKLKENWAAADAVVTVSPMKPSPLHALIVENDFVFINENFKALPRQALPKFFASYGVAWVIKVSTLLQEKSFHPKRTLAWPIQREQAVDIDDLGDFVTAEALFELLVDQDIKFKPDFPNG